MRISDWSSDVCSSDLLVAVDPQAMRWAISLSILLAVGVLASGWRLKRALSTAGTAAVGGLSGLAGGAAALYGPPLILFWLGGSAGAAQVSDNIYAIFGLLAVVVGLTLWLHGMPTLAGPAAIGSHTEGEQACQRGYN